MGDRSVGPGRGTGHLPGTIEETAEAVTSAGGRSVAVACDHRDDDQVWALRDRPAGEHAGLHLLVNNVWADYERLNAGAWEEWNGPFWTQPMELFDAMFTGGVRAHYVTATLCAPLLTAGPGSRRRTTKGPRQRAVPGESLDEQAADRRA